MDKIMFLYFLLIHLFLTKILSSFLFNRPLFRICSGLDQIAKRGGWETIRATFLPFSNQKCGSTEWTNQRPTHCFKCWKNDIILTTNHYHSAATKTWRYTSKGHFVCGVRPFCVRDGFLGNFPPLYPRLSYPSYATGTKYRLPSTFRWVFFTWLAWPEHNNTVNAAPKFDWLIKVLRPTQDKIGHFGDVLSSQSLGLVLKN